MPTSRRRTALALVLLMIIAPLTAAGTANWVGPVAVNPPDEGITLTGFRVPGNATVLEGWLHVTDTTVATSPNGGISWEGADLDDGWFSGTEYNSDLEQVILLDDGTRSNISNFDDGLIEVTLSDDYRYNPGWERVYTLSESTSYAACNNSTARLLEHGWDNNFNGNLETSEILETIIYCSGTALADSVTSVDVTVAGTGYSSDNLTAIGGGGGSGFSGTYMISSGIESVTISNGGSGYGTSDGIAIICPGNCQGSGATASISSVSSSGAITAITVNSSGSGYTTQDTIYVLPSSSGGGSGASLSAVLGLVGPIHSTNVVNIGSGYTSIPTIVVSGNGSGATLDAVLGGTFDFEVVSTDEQSGPNCEFGGYQIDSGLDINDNNNLDATEISNTTYICHGNKLWQATTFSNLNGTSYGDEQTMSYGVIPSEANEGIVAVGTIPGSALPRGSSGFFVLPEIALPNSENYNGLYMTFDHWYHLDSTASGGGDGAWIEYRINTGSWSSWSYIAPDGGYPSTMSTSAPSPAGAPSGAVPVFAAVNHSGWVSENVSMTGISDIDNASKIQFRFQIWTSPTAAVERPGWFIDNFDFNNDGVDFGVWHHGCYTTISASCNYQANSYGALQRTIDLSGTNSTSSIEIDMEWDLQGYYSDNACIELSLNNNSWTDISSTQSSTSLNCEDRVGAIPGYGYAAQNGVTYTSQSNAIRTVEFDIPSSFRNQATVYLRIIVDTDLYTHYGGNYPGDQLEGLTVADLRVVDYNDVILFQDDIDDPTTMSHYGTSVSGTTAGIDDWQYHIFSAGIMSDQLGFEDVTASDPSQNNADGWTRSGAAWEYGQLGIAAGPTNEPSFPYVYGTNLDGSYSNNANAFVISPTYSIPADGSAYLTFDKWVCTENYWDAVGMYIKVNNAPWQYFDPGLPGWYDGTPGYSGNAMYGNDVWMGGDCGQSDFENRMAPLDSYAGSNVKFRFQISTDSSVIYQGGYIDNFGVTVANYGQGGHWLSPPFVASSIDDFNMGWIDIDASSPDNTSIRGTLIDAVTGDVIPGYMNTTFPMSLAGVDTASHPTLKIKVLMDTSDEEATPRIHKIQVGGKRFLTAQMADYNGWQFSAGVEIVDDLINATSIAGTLTSEYIESSRPIKSITVSGNFSSGLMITAIGETGATLGQTPQGSIAFTTPETGFGLSISLPTNSWIDRLVITANFAEPARDATIDVLNDGTEEWAFPSGSNYGHYGWQSLVNDGGIQSTSATVELDGLSPSTVNIRLPSLAAVYGGIIAIAPDANGFEAPVSVSIGSSSQTSSSSDDIFYNFLDYSQVAGINNLGTSHIDSSTGREWRDVEISIDSNSAQSVTLTRLGIGYLIFENVSGLGNDIAAYHSSLAQDDPPPTMISIPLNVTAEMGSLSIDGDVNFDYIITNRDFQVPNTLYPTGEMFEITTKHHHLIDNINLETISLKGTASDGEILMFEVTNGADGLWGTGSDPVSFSQSSGNSVAPMDISASSVELLMHNDGNVDVVVHWNFSVSWMWDDVDSIRWVSQAYDTNDETVWPAVSLSGQNGKKAVENDLQIDSFEVHDQFGRLLSNQYSTFYPYTMVDGSELNITGSVRFQDSTDDRPSISDFNVGLNLSGGMYLLTSGEDGTYHTLITPPAGLDTLVLVPEMITVGPTGSSLGAEDVTGNFANVQIRVDNAPPVAGPIEVNTPTGLQPAHGKVWDPTVPLSVFVTIDEGHARGEIVTLHYWRESVDDIDGDGIADADEYLSQTQPLTSGMTGQQQVNFAGIDVSGQSFNSPVHMWIEGTDWAGLSYQDGGTGGGAGAVNSWASVIIATDEPTSLLASGYNLDRQLGYLLPGVTHTFSMQIEEPNGLNTLDNVSVMLCGDGSTNLGKLFYNPSRGTLWTATDSLVSPISAQTAQVTSTIIQLSINFEISWNFPWEDGQNSCKPSISILDDFTTVASQNNIGSLSWSLDNQYVAIPDSIEDMTPPQVLADGVSVYLGQGDEFEMSGTVYYVGSGAVATSIPDDLEVQYTVIYGTQEITVSTGVNDDGTFMESMILPSRVPLMPTMDVTTSVLNMPGLGTSVSNSDATVTVDSKAPTVLFDQSAYPDSSLTIIESDRVDEVFITVTMVDEIGMIVGSLDVSWVYLRNNLPVAGSEGSGQLPMIDDGATKDVYQDILDLTPLNGMKIEQGDQIAFWVTSTDRAGNEVSGLGSASAPRIPSLRIMEFLGTYSRSVINPTMLPLVGEMLTIQTFWENTGKRDGEFEVGLYELKTNPDGTSSWTMSFSTLRDGDVKIVLNAQSSSVMHNFQWESWQEGQPILVLVVNQDFENNNRMNVELSGINVQPIPIETSNDNVMILIAVGALALIGVGFFVMRNRGGDDYYYEDDDDDSYYEEDEKWEYDEESKDQDDEEYEDED